MFFNDFVNTSPVTFSFEWLGGTAHHNDGNLALPLFAQDVAEGLFGDGTGAWQHQQLAGEWHEEEPLECEQVGLEAREEAGEVGAFRAKVVEGGQAPAEFETTDKGLIFQNCQMACFLNCETIFFLVWVEIALSI